MILDRLVGVNDTEFIGFAKDEIYYCCCSCGKFVNGSDVCEEYNYNSDENVINLKCIESHWKLLLKLS